MVLLNFVFALPNVQLGAPVLLVEKDSLDVEFTNVIMLQMVNYMQSVLYYCILLIHVFQDNVILRLAFTFTILAVLSIKCGSDFRDFYSLATNSCLYLPQPF